MTYRDVDIDEFGRSDIIAVNGDDEAEVGRFGDGLVAEDKVTLIDGSDWTVDEVRSYIQTGGSGCSNYVSARLVRRGGQA